MATILVVGGDDVLVNIVRREAEPMGHTVLALDVPPLGFTMPDQDAQAVRSSTVVTIGRSGGNASENRDPDVLAFPAALRSASEPQVLNDLLQSFDLRRREREVVLVALDGLSVKQVADRLGCRIGTVSTYWQRIFAKTCTRSQVELYGVLLRRLLMGRPRLAPPGKYKEI
ncbi:MAG: response regulator transcription factor [Deltaproteobacteria bacterium]|nr:response regulator transcription factor [Deltaproteobacteria bacterium]